MHRRATLLLFALVSLVLAACGSLEGYVPTPSVQPTQSSARPDASRPARTPTPSVDLDAFLAVAADDPRSKGQPSAPITIIEYADFE